MTARLFKDATASSVHAPTALGNQGKPKRKAGLFSGIRKPVPNVDIDIDVDKQRDLGKRLIQAAREARAIARNQFAKATLVKIDETLGLVFGFAIVSKQNGEDYYDLQNDHIPEDAMLKASLDFMLNSRVAKEMHTGDEAGTVVFAFPLTSDIAKALDIETKQTGLLIAMRPAEGMLAKFKSGEFTGFSIGGYRLVDEEAV